MKKTQRILLLITFALYCTAATGQEVDTYVSNSFIKGQHNVSLSGTFQKIKTSPDVQNVKLFGPKIEVLYGFNDWLEAGVFVNYLGMSIPLNYHLPKYLHCGVESKAHLFPVIIKPSFSFIDIYGMAKIGSHTFFPNGIPQLHTATGFFISGGAGVAINLSRRWGVFCEWEYSNLKSSNMTVGLNFRFGGHKK